jgi:PST family polysaccharide transporter/lipopolysaccharide exporter
MTEIRSTSHAIGWRGAQLAGTQLISLLRLMVLATLLAPDAFGLVAVASITIALLMGVSNLGMVQALVQRPSPTEAEYDIAWTVGMLRAALVSAVLVLLAPMAAGLFGEPDAGPIVRVMALRPVVDAAASIGVAKLTRALAFRRLAVMAIPASAADTVVAIALAPTLGVWALVAGTLTGAAVQTLLSYVVAPHRPRFRRDFAAAAPLVRYGQWILYTGVISLAGTALTQVAISRWLGAAALGKYFVASKLAFLPSEAAAAVIGAVAFPLYAAYRYDARRSAATFGSLLAGQAVLLLPAFAILIAVAPLLESVLGVRWADTAPTIQILVAACMTGLFGDAIGPLLLGQGRSDRVFAIEVVQTGVRLLLLIPFIRWFGVPGAALAWLGGNVAAQVAGVIFMRDVLRGGLDAVQWKRLAAALGAAGLAFAAAFGASAVLEGFPGLLVAGVLATSTAVLTLWVLHQRQGLRLQELLPWHSSWGSVAPVPAVEPAPVPDAMR